MNTFFGISERNKKARIRVISKNLEKLLTEHVRKEPRNRILLNPYCLQLNYLTYKSWRRNQIQDCSKDNAVRNRCNTFYDLVDTRSRKKQQGSNQVGYYGILSKMKTWFKPSTPYLHL